MKAITICQPWAWAIISGPKRYENRRWPCYYRGPLLIHAGQSRDWLDSCVGLQLMKIDCPHPSDLVFGAILGIVDMIDCKRPSECGDSPFAEGPWCHVYWDPRRFAEPIKYRGQQGLFDVPDEVVRAAIGKLDAAVIE